MAKIINGYAQPDVEATKGDETILTFVETPSSFKANQNAIARSLGWLMTTRPRVKVNIVITGKKEG